MNIRPCDAKGEGAHCTRHDECKRAVKLAGKTLLKNGGDEYVEIRNEFYRDVQGTILVYDVTSRASFNALDSWIEEATAHGAKEPIVTVVANKTDKKPREVSEAEGRAWANHHGMLFAEASAKDGTGVHQLFEALFAKVCAADRR